MNEHRVLERTMLSMHLSKDAAAVDRARNIADRALAFESPNVLQVRHTNLPAVRFCCPICMEAVVDPCVTRCGHLFCWTCIYRWLAPGMSLEEQVVLHDGAPLQECGHDSSRRSCPTCRYPCSVRSIIPIYVCPQDELLPSSADIQDIDDNLTLSSASTRSIDSRASSDLQSFVSWHVPPRPAALSGVFQTPLRRSNDTPDIVTTPTPNHRASAPDCMLRLLQDLYSLWRDQHSTSSIRGMNDTALATTSANYRWNHHRSDSPDEVLMIYLGTLFVYFLACICLVDLP
jgi:Zinc finger, C3HC4 type (RING finger)